MYFEFRLSVIFILAIGPAVGLTFTPEDIVPCRYQPVSEVHCDGPAINDQTLRAVGKALGTGEIRMISINSTDITDIPDNFTDAVIDVIFVERNRYLKAIHPNAFRKSAAITALLVRDNPQLADPNVITLARNLAPRDTIAISGNAITEIPANALRASESTISRLKHIYLSKNKIKKVGANAFLGHPHLVHVLLDDNGLQQLDNDSLALTYSHEGLIYVFLDDNQLTPASFAPRTFGELQFNPIKLDLESNRMSDLPESVFRQFLWFKGSQVFLYNNTINCSCGQRWLLEEDIADNVLGLYCANFNKSIDGLTAKELGCSS